MPWIVLAVAVACFVTGLFSFLSVRTSYYGEQGSYSSARPGFFTVAMQRHRPAMIRAFVGIGVGLVGIVVFGLLMNGR